MQSASDSTDKDLRKMFDKLHKGIIEKREKLENRYCKWSDCDVNSKFDDCEDLLMHIKPIYQLKVALPQFLEFINVTGQSVPMSSLRTS